MRLAKSAECTGCEACASVCDKNAIRMRQTSEGFFIPEIDTGLCVQCGKCERACPANNPISDYFIRKENSVPRLYAASNKNFAARYAASSGGIFTILAEEILAEGGVVFGAEYGENFTVRHGYTEDMADISRFRTSKYVQSTIGDSYRICRGFLDGGRRVLFSGTPCQIDGLYRFLKKEYDSLITVDLICSGNVSPGIWKKYLDYMEGKKRAKIQQVNFRDKKYGWDRFSLYMRFSSGREYRRIAVNDPYLSFFFHHYSMRECCYDCSYKDIKHGSEFVLGDFWGVQYTMPELYDDCGLSFVLVNNERASELWDKVSWHMEIRELSLELLEKHNKAMICSADRPPDRETFYEDYMTMGFGRLIRKYARIPIWRRSNLLYDRYRCLRGRIGSLLRGLRGIVGS